MASLRKFATKKNFLIGLIGLLFLLITFSIFLLLFAILKTDENIEKSTEVIELENNYTTLFINNTRQDQLPERTTEIFKLLESEKSTNEEKYEAIRDLVYHLSSGYSIDHTPAARLFIINDLNDFAKGNFPDLYTQDDFDMACLDETCGASINAELQEIIDIIKNIDLAYNTEDQEIVEYNREIILGNLTNMALLGESGEQFEVISLGTLVIDQLEQDKKNYEQPAILLKDYLNDKYGFEYIQEDALILDQEYADENN